MRCWTRQSAASRRTVVGFAIGCTPSAAITFSDGGAILLAAHLDAAIGDGAQGLVVLQKQSGWTLTTMLRCARVLMCPRPPIAARPRLETFF